MNEADMDFDDFISEVKEIAWYRCRNSLEDV
ncbi:hypothetical protein [Campylobacter phage CJLB-10]|nr:hypothetical protein [Campylobacter phage CJLB-10]